MHTPFTPEQAQAIGRSHDKGANLADHAVTDELVRLICQNQHLVNISLEGTLITDAALQHLAQLPRLEYLWLNRTAITGAGFAHFGADSKLCCTHIEHTLVDDAGLQHIAHLPRMGTVRLDHTRITWDGLLALAHQQRFHPVSEQQFSAAQMEEFIQTQRQLAKKSTAIVPPEDMQAASAHLQGFFDAMSQWERDAMKQSFSAELAQRSLEIFRQFCTTAHHHTPRQHASGMPGGSYGKHHVTDSERISKNRLYLYTQDKRDGAQYRFLLIRHADGGWRVDKVQCKSGGWSQNYL